MLQLGSTYLLVKDMEKSISFYEKLLEMKVSSQNFNRWAQFNIGHSCIALLNKKYDFERIRNNDRIESAYNKAFLEYTANMKIRYGNNFVLNFYIDDLNKEYERVKNLNIGDVSEIFFINVKFPYYCFMLEDPDGNQIEITGKYKENE